MQCPYCRSLNNKVVDSRLVGEGQQIRRRRECIECRERFTTYESVELSLPRLIKQDGSYVEFNEKKLRNGLLRSTEKRPVSLEQIDHITNQVINKLRACGEREVTTRTIGEWVMIELKDIDEVAYVRFASVYRRFQDVEEFNQEILRLKERACHSEEDLA